MPLDEILPNDFRAPREARQAVTRFLSGAGVPQLIDEAQLLASELVTNAVRHAKGPITVRAYVADGFLHLQVCDSSADCVPQRREAGTDDEGGRGIELVEKLSNRWGYRVTEHSKIVWLDLRV
jgi:anti-sigma regulatory factor (Ser/Thr protein kinase)